MNILDTVFPIPVKRLRPDAIIPQYATEGAACFDLRALMPDGLDPNMQYKDWEFRIAPGEAHIFHTGLAFEVPLASALMIYSRSGHGFKNSVRLSNCSGVIDSDYRGEVMVRLANDDSRMPFTVKKGDRIAQAMLVWAPRLQLVPSFELTVTERGEGGLGSTGKA